MNIQEIKQELSRVFDDDLHTKQWHNIVDYTIIALIIISTVEVFLSTFDGVVEKYGRLLHWVDVFTTVVFTVEVSLRIWCADLLDEKYKGFLGRVRYCFSFYGLIDILSTYPFYLNFVMNIPYTVLKTLRIARLFRIFRYMKSFRLLSEAINSKKMELWVSLQFLFIVTIILSFILFFVEHDAQPDVYVDGTYPVVWAFAQYIGDPGGFAENPPITFVGRLIACIIGILGIAIFAVPAGLIGSGFTDAMDNDRKKKKIIDNIERLRLAFETKLDRLTGFQIVPRYLSVVEIQARMGLTATEIIEATTKGDEFRLINLACTRPADERPEDKLGVEHFSISTVYGQCINRNSKVTIFAPSNIVDPIAGWWAYYLAKIGGFNYVSREFGEARPYQSYYTCKPELQIPGRDECMNDLNQFLDKEDKWLFTVLPSSGANEPTLPTQFHFGYGAKKGDETFDDPNITLNDVTLFKSLYSELSELLLTKYQLSADYQRYHNNSSKANFARHLNTKVNVVCLRVAWSVLCWDMRAIQIAYDFAAIIKKNCEALPLPESKDLMKASIGYID
ncbi:MAG: ion transporter [Bacteroidales bacterium]|nr:ion transporter [Bacteroidales bacterium]